MPNISRTSPLTQPLYRTFDTPAASKCSATFVLYASSGGVFSAICPKVNILGMVSFTENTAVLDGGAISLTDPAEFYIGGTYFSANKAESGGAVSLTATEPTKGGFERCRFDSNEALNGGALHFTTGDTGGTEKPSFVQDSVFRRNVARESSSICRTLCGCRFRCSDCAFLRL